MMRNKLAMFLAVFVVLSLATKAWCLREDDGPSPTPTPRPFAPPGDAFQIRYASNLSVGDSVVNISNSGTQGSTDAGGSICANVYVFNPDETMAACCSCKVTPNALNSLSARNDLIANTLTPAVPTSIVIKLLASIPAKTGTSCDPSAPTVDTLASGMRAWGTTLHALPTSPVTYGVTETPFSNGGLSPSELTELTEDCGLIKTEGSGFGICRSCRLGGL